MSKSDFAIGETLIAILHLNFVVVVVTELLGDGIGIRERARSR